MRKCFQVLATLLLLIQAATAGEVRFQQGVDGYAGAVDTEIWEVSPNKALARNGQMTVDADNGGGQSHVLIKFHDIFGDKARQITKGARILQSRLIVLAFDPGNSVNLHRMCSPWDVSATWNSMVSGISADGNEATPFRDGLTFGNIVMDKQSIIFDVTATVQAWSNGDPNYGWAFLPTGGNGWDFYSSDWPDAAFRPTLVVEFERPAAE